jgi:hypothetical protein
MQHDFILLDRSQSMSEAGKWPEALAAINAYVEKLAKNNVDTGVTLATFDKPAGDLKFEIIRSRITPSTWKAVSNEDAQPRGWTPLNDAIGQIVTMAKAGINGGGEQYEKVAIIIVTDGQENSSKELTHAAAKAMLDECRGKGWQVIFLGADFDNAAQAASYGVAASQTIKSSVGNLRATMAATADMRAAYDTTGAAMNYTDEQKQQAATK